MNGQQEPQCKQRRVTYLLTYSYIMSETQRESSGEKVREFFGGKFNFTWNSRVLPYRQYFKLPADVANITLP
jgi:hypothetical protein